MQQLDVLLKKIEKVFVFSVTYLFPLFVFIFTLIIFLGNGKTFLNTQEFWGNGGLNLLFVVMFIKPIQVLFRKYFAVEYIRLGQGVQKFLTFIHAPLSTLFQFIKNIIYSLLSYLLRFRRELGVLSFWFIFLHTILWYSLWYHTKRNMFFNITHISIWTGTIGVCALLIGYLTSNNASIRFLKKYWKWIQRFAYVAFTFAMIHLIFIFKIQYIFVLIIYWLLKLLEWDVLSIQKYIRNKNIEQ